MLNRKRNVLSLAGEWRFTLDPQQVGVENEFYSVELQDTIKLPGTTDEGKKGTYNEKVELGHLTREYPFVGAAWYQRSIEVSERWMGKCIRLVLERTKSSSLWLDDSYIGTQDSLCTPHVYELGTLVPGIHRITLRIDNSILPPVGGCHQLSEETQTNWNGIVGDIELQALDRVWIEDVQAYPDVHAKTVRVDITVHNQCVSDAYCRISVSAESISDSSGCPATSKSVDVKIPSGASRVTLDYFIGSGALLWDDISPNLYKLKTFLAAQVGEHHYDDQVELCFGMRKFAAKGTQFAVNDRTIFLRGKNDACVFPLTGYAPMDVEHWVKVFNTANSYGINHYRFHTWCPPEAAFSAADRVGIYLQPELPNWRSFLEPSDSNYNPSHAKFLREEGRRILKAYGNHPSFVMMTLGNELFGSRTVMSDIINEFRQFDSRHLYAQGTNNFYSNTSLAEGDDFWVTMRTSGVEAAVRGSFSHADLPLGHIQTGPPSTLTSYLESIRDIRVPVIGHEIGQYQAYPNFGEIRKYTGVLQPRNLESFRQMLADKGMLDQAGDFLQASGKLQVLCYREEIEAALRTPEFAGFQLLDLQDFPGQGTALVGILDAFMESKGYVEPAEWREFCADTVLLALMSKYTYCTGERFVAEIKVAHYGWGEIGNAVVQWSLISESGDIISAGEFAPITIGAGRLTSIGSIAETLRGIHHPERLTLELKIKDTRAVNHYPVWLYPTEERTLQGQAAICRNLADALRSLKDGRNCLLIPELSSLTKAIDGAFTPDFWCYPMFKAVCDKMHLQTAAGTLGILCDPAHPALRQFTTESHSNWQWWHILQHSKSVILDEMPKAYRPVVQVIDNCYRNHKLGLICEAAVCGGKLLICTSDLLSIQDKPEARQLLYSLLGYIRSADFTPAFELDENQLYEVLQ